MLVKIITIKMSDNIQTNRVRICFVRNNKRPTLKCFKSIVTGPKEKCAYFSK